jgi:hypothetical protein
MVQTELTNDPPSRIDRLLMYNLPHKHKWLDPPLGFAPWLQIGPNIYSMQLRHQALLE